MNHPAIPELKAAIPELESATSAANWSGVGLSRKHESAELHVLGQATYTDDIPELQGTLHAALGLSTKAHANITAMDLEPVKNSPGVVAVFTATDIPGVNDMGPIIHDDPILSPGLVQYVGQPIFIVVADTHNNARRACGMGEVMAESYRLQISALEGYGTPVARVDPHGVVRNANGPFFGRAFDAMQCAAEDPLGVPDVALALYDWVIIWDHADDQAQGPRLAGHHARRRH